MAYTVSDKQKGVVLNALEVWMRSENLHAIHVDKVTGSGGRTQSQVHTYDGDLLAAYHSPDELLDDVIEEHGQFGGKLQLRGEFEAEEGKQPQMLRRSFTLVRAANTSGAKGAEAGAEAIMGSVSKLFDSKALSTDRKDERIEALSTTLITTQLAQMEQRLADSTRYQDTIRDLQLANARLEMKLEFIEAQEPGMLERLPPEVLIAGAQVLIPVVGELLAVGTTWLKTRALNGAPAPAQVEAPVEEPDDELDEDDGEPMLPVCPTCDADEGSPCRKAGGGLARTLHAARLALMDEEPQAA